MAIHQPHDHLFKRVFGAPAEAASFLQARLPALSRSLHWPTLKRLPASFVAPDLRGSDLLFEHQSTPDYWLRLLGYCCRIWEHDRRDHQDAGYLRPILPLVFYQGPTGWQHSPQFADLFPAATRDWPWLPRFEHVLFDQTQMSPAQAAGSVRARLLQLTMMHAFSRAVREARERIGPLFDDLEREGSGGQDDMKMFMHYIAETGPEDTPEAMGDILSRTAAGGELMTSGERLRQEGRDQMRDQMRNEMRAVAEQRHREGRSEGRLEGRLEGQREGRLETIDGLLRTGVDWSLIERATGIGEQEYRQLRSRPNGAAAAGGDGT